MGMFFKNGTSMADLVNAARNDQSYLFANIPEMTNTNAKQITDILVNKESSLCEQPLFLRISCNFILFCSFR